MRRLLSIAVLLTGLVAATPARAWTADLVISEITNTGQRVAVGELFEYQVTVKNIGGWFCVNGFRLVIRMPPEVELVDNSEEERRFRPNSPFTCKDGTCRADPGYYFWPGRQLSTTVLARAKGPSQLGVAMRARVEADGCAEDNRANNHGTSPRSVIFQRPQLKAEFVGAQGLAEVPRRNDQSGVHTVTVTNIGAGPAVDVAMVDSHLTRSVNGLFNVPQFLSAYRGTRVSEQSLATRLRLSSTCNTFVDGAFTRQLCLLRVTLSPQEQIQVRYRWGDVCPPGNPRPRFEATIRAETADDPTQEQHTVSMFNSC